jgi:deoxyribose-phosphate aldolase
MKEQAKRALGLLDLTSLNDNDTDETVVSLCRKAHGEFGHTAAVCIWPRFVKLSKKELEGTPVRIATVVNFPHGGTDIDATVAETKQAIADGADEIDVVLPYKAFMSGDKESARALLKATREACKGKTLKVIIESGVLAHADTIADASRLSIECGADFIKTSTGKTPVSATPEAANVMLEVIRDSGKPVGFKASGGVRTTEQAVEYMTLADKIMGPKWISPKTFRFGASGLRDSLLASMGYGEAPASSAKGY